MPYKTVFLILGFSISLYLAFLFLGFFLRDKNLIAQNIKKEK